MTTITNTVRTARPVQVTVGARPRIPVVRTGAPMVRTGAPAMRTGVPMVRTGLVRLRVSADDSRRRELSDREIQVLTLVASGGTRDEISRQLGMAPGTVASHMSRIYRALGARNAAHAVALAHGSGVMTARPQPPAPFVSRRERQVLAGLAHGLTSEQVAEYLSLSIETVKTHLRRVYKKLGVTCRANAVDTAISRRLLAVVVDTNGAAPQRGIGRPTM